MANVVKQQIQEARKSLLDLTMRNRLLNYKPTKARTLKIIDEIPSEVYDYLVIREKEMEFLPVKDTPLDKKFSEDEKNLNEQEEAVLWQLPRADVNVDKRYVDRFLQTNLPSDVLQKRLFYIDQQARSVLEEQGYSVLYLAIGFLKWLEIDSSEPRKAPLILIPVELNRAGVNNAFKLKWNGDDIVTNMSLQSKLSERSYEVNIPNFEMPEDKKGINSYLEKIKKKVKIHKWDILSDIYLDFFSFTKFVMYKDLDSNSWPTKESVYNHPLLQELIEPSGKSHDGFTETEIDTKLTAHETYHVMDADPSQISVIEDAKSGFNLAVEGPPGTGKSQTIVNLIAELLYQDKSVLFVSEKMAALEVVKQRLDNAGLGDFCLELHSRKSNKKEVLKELERIINNQPPKDIFLQDKCSKLERIKKELNDYAKAIREPFGKIACSPFDMYGNKESAFKYFADREQIMPRIHLGKVQSIEKEELAEIENSLIKISDMLELINPISSNPWKGCYPEIILPSDDEFLENTIERCIDSFDHLKSKTNELIKLTAVTEPKSLSGITIMINDAELIASSKQTDKKVLLNNEWDVQSEKASSLIGKIANFQTRFKKIKDKFNQKVFEKDIEQILEQYKELSAKFLKFLYKQYRALKKELKSIYLNDLPRDKNTIIKELKHLNDAIDLRKSIHSSETDGINLFGSYWEAELSNTEKLKKFSEWINSFRKRLISGAFNDNVIDIVSKGVDIPSIEKAIDEVASSKANFEQVIEILDKKLKINFNEIFAANRNNLNLVDFHGRLFEWKKSLSKLQIWSKYIYLKQAVNDSIAKPITDFIENNDINPEDLIHIFKGNFADDFLNAVFAERTVLSKFIGEMHEKNIKRFRELDIGIIENKRQKLAYELYCRQPHNLTGASRGSEAGILLGEFSRKRGHMPIRKLLIETGSLIKQLKRCFMMSPLSIAQYLDPVNSIRFDVVIFDEASQVKPEDAFGALLRANQAIIMGDTQQLPPTSFFDSMIDFVDDPSDDDASASISDVESVLHQSKRSFTTRLLKWHYRSKHESLIAVSNREFYDNSLKIYPSPIASSKDIGLQVAHLPHAIYDRGRSSTNREEAKEVANAAIEHFEKFPEKSLGIGTFNIKQQQAILEEIELQLRLNPDMEDFFRSDRFEHFFVKNLETIQGDERDVIFLSIGFGFDENGSLSRNFGPLNNEGGYRRLNVLITRAREKCVVFSNFKAKDLIIENHSSHGLKALKMFLSFAEDRKFLELGTPLQDADSPFEESVYEFLKSHGYDVKKQVGCAGFRVDLAINDPNLGKYILGIECDGAKYHSSPIARDRDRLRQQILEGLGWHIYRIWSTDWYRNRLESENKLLMAIEKAKLTKQPTKIINVIGTTDILREKKTKNTNDIESSIKPYIKFEYQKYSSKVDQLEKKYESFFLGNDYYYCAGVALVKLIVDVEEPIHETEIIKRIRDVYGYSRTVSRISNHTNQSIAIALKQKIITRKKSFLWSINQKNKLSVRQRDTDPPAKIDLICDEEIELGIYLALKAQFASLPRDLAVRTSRLFGIKVTQDATLARINKVINNLIRAGSLYKLPNSMINLNHKN